MCSISFCVDDWCAFILEQASLRSKPGISWLGAQCGGRVQGVRPGMQAEENTGNFQLVASASASDRQAGAVFRSWVAYLGNADQVALARISGSSLYNIAPSNWEDATPAHRSVGGAGQAPGQKLAACVSCSPGFRRASWLGTARSWGHASQQGLP